MPLALAGTGQLQVIQILAYLNLYSPQLLLLDEPDAHIHPDKQKALLRVICDWAEADSAKVLIATHSRHLLDALDGDASFHWMQNGTRQQEDDYDRVKVLMDLGALDRSDLLKNGTIKFIVLTEDKAAGDTSRTRKSAPLRKLLFANGFCPNQTQFWSYDGCTNLHTAKVLSEFIRENAAGVQILIHRDRDYLSDDQVASLRTSYTNSGLDVFITDGTDVESHFITESHIASITSLPRDDVRKFINDATTSTQEGTLNIFSRARMAQARILRRAAGQSGEPSPHEINTACTRDLIENPSRYRHGKKTLSKLRELFHATGRQYGLLAATEHLHNDLLKKVSETT